MRDYSIEIVYMGNNVIAQERSIESSEKKWYKDERCAYCEPYSDKKRKTSNGRK